MTEKQIEKYRAHLKHLIEEKSNNLNDPAYADIKEFLRGKVEAYTVALDSFDIILEESD